MVSVKDIMKNIPASRGGGEDGDVMTNPDYLRKSLSLISEALQKGFDVLQLENGDIVTTGTKTIVTTYRWDPKSKKMAKVAARQKSEKSKKDKK